MIACLLLATACKRPANQPSLATNDRVPVAYSITGTVESVGPVGSYVVLGQGTNTLKVTGSNKFTFVTPLIPGQRYRVIILQTSPGLVCAVTNGSGTMPAAPVNNIQVHCAPPAMYTWPFDAGTSAQYTFDSNLIFAGGTIAIAPNDTMPRSVYANTAVKFSHLYRLDYMTGPPGCPSTFAVTFSPDAVTWYYHAALQWQVANGKRNQSMDAYNITPQLLNDYANFAGPGTFYVKSFLISDGNTPCSLDAINVTYDQNSVTQVANVAVRFVLTGYSTPRTAGTSGSVTVTAYDAFGGVATSYLGSIVLTSTDPQAGLGTAYTFASGDAGVAVLPATLFTAGTQAMAAHDTNNLGVSGTQMGILVQPGLAAHLRLTPVFICDGPALPLRVEYDLPGSWETHIQSN